jgi:hypothetical protein
MDMRFLLVAIAVAALPGTGRAGTLVCQFTEPFFSISYDSETGRVTMISADETDPGTGQPLPRIIAEGAKLRNVKPDEGWRDLVLEKAGETILELKLTGQGSDGMSETVFPFEANYGSHDGGCDTGKYPAFDPYDLLQDLGASM